MNDREFCVRRMVRLPLSSAIECALPARRVLFPAVATTPGSGFGSAVRVVAPERLVSEIWSELDAAPAAYARRSQFPMLRMAMTAERATMSA